MKTAVFGNSIDWGLILGRLQDLATSEKSKSLLQNLSPLDSPEAAILSFAEIEDARTVLSYGSRPFAESLDHFDGWYGRLKRDAVLQPQELRDVRRFLSEVLALKDTLKPIDRKWTRSIQKKLANAEPPLSAIDHLLSPSGEIRTDASEALYNLYREKLNQTKNLHQTLDRLVKTHDLDPVLQERFVTTREGRWVIPVKSGMQHFFQGVIHGSSQSKQTVFMEPSEVVPLNNRLSQIEIEIEAEIERLLVQTSQYLKTLCLDFLKSHEALLTADITFAKATLSDLLEANPIHFSNDGILLKEIRHPVLILGNKDVVPNTITLGSFLNSTRATYSASENPLEHHSKILLLSGPNAGGKTVLLKSIGLAAHMARCGLPICANTSSIMPFFKTIHVAVGDEQSVDADLSTFAAHIQSLGQAAKYTGTQSLILIDEICGSTDPEEGSALARSFLETFAKNGVFGVVTSHLGPLKLGWSSEHGVINGSLEYNQESGLPTYLFLMGIPGQSLALQTAKRVGIDTQILNRAFEHLSPDAKVRQKQLEDLEAVKEELGNLRRNLFQELKAARESKEKYQELIKIFKKDRDVWMARTLKKAEQKVDRLLDVANIQNIFQKHERLQAVKQSLPEIIKASPQGNPARRKIETPTEFENAYPPGSKIFVPSIGTDGLIQGKINQKGEILILANSMRLSVPWQDLRPSHSFSNPTQNILRKNRNIQVRSVNRERDVDLRGKSQQEAISDLEGALDQAVLRGDSRIKIIHGHGNETLKRAIRAHLSRSIHVKKWKAADTNAGGDGVTWADLKE